MPQVAGLTAGFPSLVQAAPSTYAPGEIVSVYGTSLCGGQQAAGPPLPDALAGSAVWLDNTQLPLYYASAGQINAVLPYGATAGPHTLRVGRYTDSSDTELAAQSLDFAIQVSPVSMDFVEIQSAGSGSLAVQFQDGRFANASQPVKPGDYVSLYLTGLGVTNPEFPDGVAPGTTGQAVTQPQIVVQGAAAQILYAGVQPEYPGLDQIVLQVPQYSLPAGKTTATFTISAPSVSQTVNYEVPAL
jgi:uncharacterized protein (TIGR03437 family)